MVEVLERKRLCATHDLYEIVTEFRPLFTVNRRSIPAILILG
jgi:hypothetical protein